jgi:hypothetical protein
MGKQKPKFDPNQPYEEVDDSTGIKPKFDPNQPFEEVEEKDISPSGLFVEGSENTSNAPKVEKKVVPGKYDFSKDKVENKFFTPESTQPKQEPALSQIKDKAVVDRSNKAEKEILQNVESGPSRVTSFAANINQAFYGTPADIAEGLAIATNGVSRGVFGSDSQLQDDLIYKGAQWYRGIIEELSPVNDAYKNSIDSQIAKGGGDMAALILSGGLKESPALLVELNNFNKAGNLMAIAKSQGGQIIGSPPALVGALKTGTAEYNQAKAEGATDDQAFAQFIKTAAVGGVLEAAPVLHYFNRLDKTSGGGVRKAITNGAIQGVEEMTTEVAQQVYSNVSAANTYNATREWYDGLTESGGIGFGLGFVLGAMGTSLRSKMAEAKTLEEVESIQEAIDFVDEKAGELKSKQESTDKNIQDAEANTKADTGTQRETTEIESDQPLSERSSVEVDKGAVPVVQKVADETVVEQKDTIIEDPIRPLSENTQNVIAEEIKAAEAPEASETKNLDLVLQKQDIQKSLENPELSELDREIIETQLAETENKIINEKAAKTEEGGKEITEASTIQEGQELEEKPVVEQPIENSEVVNPPTEEEANVEPEEVVKLRKFTQQVLNDPDISEEFKAGITEDAINYVPTSNSINNKEADLFIESNGPDVAFEKLSDTKNEMKPKARVSVANKLIKFYNKQASEATTDVDKAKSLDMAIKTTDFIAKHLTELGQGVQAASMYTKLSPEGVLRYAQKEVDRTRKKEIEKVAPKLRRNREVIDQINKEAVSKVLSNPKVKSILENKIKNSSETRKKAVKKATDFLEGLKIDTKGKAGDVTYILPAAAWNGAISTIQKSLEVGLSVVEAIDAAVKYVKSTHDKEWDEERFRKDFSGKLSKYEAGIDPAGAARKGMKDLNIVIPEIIQEHYTKVDNAKKTLVQKILDNSDLTAVDAKEIARNIESEFDRLTTAAKKKALIKGLSVKSILPNSKEKQYYDEMIKLSNLGALSDAEWKDFYANKFDLPKLTTEQALKLTSLADKVQNAKEGEAKNKATQDLLAYQEKLKGINWVDVGSSVWYANILSGLSTQVANAYSGFMEVLGELAVSSIKNPKSTGFLLGNLFNGYARGGLIGLDVLKTGYQPDKGTKIDVPSNLENIKFKVKFNPYKLAKYVSRLMTAVDILHYHGLKQMRAGELAYQMAQKEGKLKPTTNIKNRAIEILHKTKGRVKEAKNQAQEEGLEGKAFKRRVYELMEQSRPEQINDDASDFAAHGTFNYDPEGVVGAIASAINGASAYTREVAVFSPIQFIVPFTRVVANVMNRSLDWTPHGYVRALKGGMGSGKFSENRWSTKYTPEQKQREIIKATLGTIGMAALWAMSDEEEGSIEITADGTGDQKKNYELQETGWRPYSVKIGDKWFNYQNTPLSIPFANIGFARDAQKYKGEKDIESKISIAMFGGTKYMMDMSFLGSLSGFFGAFGKNNPNGGEDFMNKISKEGGRTLKGFVVPNAFTQASKSIQEIYELPTKRANGILEEFIRDMPALRDDLDNMYNTLGDPIIPDQNRKYLPFKIKSDENDKVWDLIIESKANIGAPSKSTIVYDPKTETERELTDKEYNKFALESGRLTKKMILEEYTELKKMSKAEAKDRIEEIKTEARKEIKENLLN